jgi:hypothetical protein
MPRFINPGACLQVGPRPRSDPTAPDRGTCKHPPPWKDSQLLPPDFGFGSGRQSRHIHRVWGVREGIEVGPSEDFHAVLGLKFPPPTQGVNHGT